MAKFVPDIKTKRWVIIAPTRLERPADIHKDQPTEVKKENTCPFCPGNESMTPPEIMRVGEGEPDTPGWIIRVIPNKYPITDIHEVIIHSKEHDKNIKDFSPDHITSLLKIYRERFLTHENDGQVIVFSNDGAYAGASLAHPHSQVVVIPQQINFDALVREPVNNVVEDDTYFVTYCPDFSQWPYEVWIAPKKEHSLFAECSDGELKDLSILMKRTLQRLSIKYSAPETQKIHDSKAFAYNYYIYHAKNWFIRVIPRLVHRAGFELGTGLSVNITDPTKAAEELRNISV